MDLAQRFFRARDINRQCPSPQVTASRLDRRSRLNALFSARHIAAFIFVFQALATIVFAAPLLAADDAVSASGANVPFRRIGVDEFQNFVKNWDTAASPVLHALIDSAAHYDLVFNPAPVIGAKRPFAPDPAIYAKEMIVMIAREMRAPQDMAKPFQVETLRRRGDDLEFRYRNVDPQSDATIDVKNMLALVIPKHPYRQVVFVENGKEIGRLDLAKGNWCVPPPKPDNE